MHMLLEFKKPYKLSISTTNKNLLIEVYAIGAQQMDLLKSNKIKRLEHLKTLQVGIWVKHVRLVASKCQDVRFAIFKLGVSSIPSKPLELNVIVGLKIITLNKTTK